jgi:hypothetical protein
MGEAEQTKLDEVPEWRDNNVEHMRNAEIA